MPAAIRTTQGGPPRPRRRRLLPALLAWTLAAIFVLLAMVAVGGRLAMTQVAGAEREIAELLGEQLGLEVEIERMSGRFLVLHPIIEASGIVMTPPGDAPAVTVAEAHLEIDVLRSLLERRLIPASLVLAGVEVALQRTPEGQIGLRGGLVAADVTLVDVLRFFDRAGHAELKGGRITLDRLDADAARPEALELDAVLSRARGVGRGHVTFDYLAAEADTAASGTLAYRLRGDPFVAVLLAAPIRGKARGSAKRPIRGAVRLEARDLVLGGFIRDLLPELPMVSGEQRPGEILGRLSALTLHARQGRQPGFVVEVAAEGPELTLTPGEPIVDVELAFAASELGAERSGAYFERLRGTVGSARLNLDGLRLRWMGDGAERIEASAPTFAARPVVRWLSGSGLLSDNVLTWLEQLAPNGQVRDGRLLLTPGQFAVAGSILGLELEAARGVPRVQGANLDFSFHEGGGWIDLDSGPFLLHFPDIFPGAWDYQSGRGRIDLQFGAGRLDLHGSNLMLRGDGVDARGAFSLHLPEAEADRSISLMIGLGASDARRSEAYLPARMNPALRSWLVDAVRSGRVAAGGVVLSGPLLPGGRPLRPELFMRVVDGTLAFDPRWPIARELSGSLQVSGGDFSAQLDTARFGGLELADVALALPAAQAGAGVLDVRGRGQASAEAALDFLEALPVDDASPLQGAGWKADGRVDLAYALRLPLDGQPPERLDVTLGLDLATLYVPMVGLDLDRVQGSLSYRDGGTLASDGLEARLFGGPVRVDFEGGLGVRHDALRLALSGRADAAALARWTTVDTLVAAHGELDYVADVTLAANGDVALGLRAGTEDLHLGLPAPFDRLAGPLMLDLVAPRDDDWELAIDWGEHDGRFRLRDNAFLAGSMGFGMPAPELPEEGLRARGDLPGLDLAAWWRALAAVEAAAVERGRPRTRTRTAAGLDLNLQLGEVAWDDTRLGPASLEIIGSTLDAVILFASEPLTGRVLAVIDQPLVIDLDRLRLPFDSVSVADDEPPLSFDDLPLDALIDMDVRVRHLQVQGEPYGHIAFELRPAPDALHIGAIEGELRGLRMLPDGRGNSRLEWRTGARPQTRYQGRIEGEDASDVLERWGFAPTTDAETFLFDLDLAWPGSPAAFGIGSLDGRVRLEVENGRFVQVDAGAAPLRVVGLFNFGAIARRMRLDFSDITRRGMAFDEIEGLLDFDSGILRSATPLRIRGPGSSFRIAAEVDLISQAIDGDIIVTLPVSRNLPWYAAYAILLANPITGAGVLVAERVFRNQIDRFSSARYRMAGTLDDPQVTFVNIWADEVDLPVRMSPDDEPDLDWLLEDPFSWPDSYLLPLFPPEETDS